MKYKNLLTQREMDRLATEMTESCDRIIELFDTLDDQQILGPKLAIVNPARWEVGHVAWFYEQWILRNLYETPPLFHDGDALYNSSAVAHETRWDLLFPTRTETRTFLTEVLNRSVQRLKSGNPDAEDAYFFRLGTYHSDMHSEALTYTRQTLGYPPPDLHVDRTPRSIIAPEYNFTPHDVYVPGGSFLLGATPGTSFVFDNEKWAHEVSIAPFRISATAVSYGEFRHFVEEKGYQRREFWSQEGWCWREEANAEHPVYWIPTKDGSWRLRYYDQEVDLPEWNALLHVNWYEADAFCQWANRRLPTEAEWELAASGEMTGDGRTIASAKRRYPWGNEPPTSARANLDWGANGTIDVRALPAGDSFFGVRQMMGNVWEWTETTFFPYPGFQPDPYEEYSEPWFGDHKVLRGGCWATRSRLIRNTWRNFYKPDRRDVMSGFRTCAR